MVAATGLLKCSIKYKQATNNKKMIVQIIWHGLLFLKSSSL